MGLRVKFEGQGGSGDTALKGPWGFGFEGFPDFESSGLMLGSC